MNFLNRFKYAKDSYFVTVLILGIVLMLNFLASRHFFKADLTKNQFYALSEASKQIVRNLDDIVTVKIFFSEQLPPNLFMVRQYVDDVLDELSSYSKGRLVVQDMDMSEEDAIDEAMRLGIPQIRMNIVEKDKFEVKNGFLGLAVMYGDKGEILPMVQNVFNVEYDLVSAIKKATSDEERAVAFLTGHDEPVITDQINVDRLQDSYVMLRKALERNYRVKIVDLSVENALDGVDTLIFAGPKKSVSDYDKYFIDDFLMRGGNIMFLIDSVNIKGNLQTEMNDNGLDDFLEHYGVKIERNLVLDRSNEHASFNQGFVNFIMPYAFWIKALNENFDQLNPIVSKLDSLVFPWISPLRIIEKEGVNAVTLISTTLSAWTQEEPFNLDPSVKQNSDKMNQYPLAVILDGEFTSFFDGKDLPEGVEITESGDVSNPGRLFVIGNSRFVTDQFLQQFGQNMPFMLNAVDYFTLDESLIGIRSKLSYDLPLKELSARDRQLTKIIGIYLMPFLVVVFGVVRYFLMKKKKFVI